jgi:predicted dithiol-disulfide oxidoreductase (DUF899 family)
MSNQKEIFEQISAIQEEIVSKKNQIIELRKQMTPEKIEDYSLRNHEGVEVILSSLFNDRNELLIIHNMGKRCVYCTLWADELNGIIKPLGDAVPFVMVSPDSPEVQKEFAESRGWQMPMLSAEGTDFISVMGFEPKPQSYWPGVSVLIQKEDGIYKTTYDHYGPGDSYCSVWHFLDLLPTGTGGWEPKYDYL